MNSFSEATLVHTHYLSMCPLILLFIRGSTGHLNITLKFLESHLKDMLALH